MRNDIDSEPKKEIVEQILNNMEREEGTPITLRRLPPISRTTWAQLPEKVRDILEEQHGYNHYNPQTDNIESKRLYCKE